MPLFPVFVVLAVFGPLICLAQGGSINGEATYVSFSVPGALGTYPMGINASMQVTGYYTVSSGMAHGFLREADGTISTFDVPGARWTQPAFINTAGDIAGEAVPPTGVAQGFLRYADGRTVVIPGNQAAYESVTVAGINDFDEIAGDYLHLGVTAFTRSRNGEFAALPPPHAVATGLNASGSVIGILPDQYGFTGFVSHPDGDWTTVGPVATSVCGDQTIPEAINAGGTIAGTLTRNYFFNSSCPINTGGFVMSPEGEFTPFQPPGQLPYYHDLLLGAGPPPLHLVSIDQAGDIAGTYIDAAGLYHGFVRNPYGTITSFDPPESKWTTVTSINAGGTIAGYYQYSPQGTGLTVGFLRVP
ncbi:MAG: hypothetical protein WA510_11515 [Acidobacteriaceae bacterium]